MGKKGKMSREEALELYGDLQKAMSKMIKNTEGMSGSPKGKMAEPAMKKSPAATLRPAPLSAHSSSSHLRRPAQRGTMMAWAFVLTFAGAKVGFALLDRAGLMSPSIAEATVMQPMMRPQASERFGKEEIKILTSLDTRRAELEERTKKLDERENDMEQRDKEFAGRLTQLRDLTSTLKVEHEKDDKKRGAQIEQLANVYGSMNPQEAAQLMEQLDTTIALALIEKMPEKRIGQILAMMNRDKALLLTKMLSGRISDR